MSRLQAVDPARSAGRAKALLEQVQAKYGAVPNMARAMAVAPAVLEGYLAFSGALAGGSIPVRLRSQLALAVSEANRCDYCVAIHSTLGSLAGLSAEEAADARRGRADDPKSAAALRFAVAAMKTRGAIGDASFDEARRAGWTDPEIAEILAHVALSFFTNAFNQAAGTPLDFPLPAPVTT